MEALMTPPMIWVVAAAIFCVGVLVGVALPRASQERGRTRELESQLQASRQELATYHDQVTQHFVQTADLLHAMTANYRVVYEHLADGAQRLCNGQVRTLSAAALRERLLPQESTEPLAAEPHNSHDPVSDETLTRQDSSPAQDATPASANSQGEEQGDRT